ncbi:TetR family transcriptional regulator [Planosporangium flavigriseum]|uniref:TetR family transcriptional regulator n=1 Tax=Planosporangium flavigriseum TaxID=373681 RepID=A0A8J3LY16_9ACTN|nr:TetR family transcriptional regulator [Planosporangium flavigriseum]NJC67360.1 TetR family transcriptional regulator [Planosporangium flavigriseum]GIG75445.1 TetR family transcriptional regulator [Planosporangium flavigriseum]
MAWQTELTRQRLLDAAVEDFAEFGAAGARVDRIATRAGISKERLYGYFGDKEALFVQVLRQELARLAAAVPLSDEQAGDLGEYAGRVLEHNRKHPALLRLLYWEGLERGGATVVDELERAGYYAEKVAAVGRAQQAGHLTTSVGAAELIYAVIALAGWWAAAPQITRMLTGASTKNGNADAAILDNSTVATLVRRMSAPD